jgi:hypothetical protein
MNNLEMISISIVIVIGISLIWVAVDTSKKISSAIPEVERGMAACNGILGRIGSFLSGSIAQKCEQVNQAPALIGFGNTMVTVALTVGACCLAFGTIRGIQAMREGSLD